MERLNLLICLSLICVASSLDSTGLDPRGNRPVEHGTRNDKCATQKEWPFCTTDEWGPKCPSGCRIQGLIGKYDYDLLKRIKQIRSLLDQYKLKHRSADQVSKQTYDYLKEKLTIDTGHDNNYFDLAQNLRQRITDMKIKIDRQLRALAALKDRVKDQVVEMQKLEVDIDIKLRSCKGSCESYVQYNIDQNSYVELHKQVKQLDSQSAQTIESVGTLYVMKSRPLQDSLVDSIYKSKDIPTGAAAQEQVQDMFPEVKTVRLVLEHEGSSSFPATVSKEPGTSYTSSSSSSSVLQPSTSSSTSSSSSSTSSSSSSSTSSKSITELGGNTDLFGPGGGFESFGQPSTGFVSTKTITCTRRTVTMTQGGPVEKVEQLSGPQCQGGGMSSFFPTLSQTSSSSSSSVTKTVQSSGTKGSLFGDAKTGFVNPFGSDLGAFMTSDAEDDLPDIHARSVKTARVERQADYIGQGTKTSDLE